MERVLQANRHWRRHALFAALGGTFECVCEQRARGGCRGWAGGQRAGHCSSQYLLQVTMLIIDKLYPLTSAIQVLARAKD